MSRIRDISLVFVALLVGLGAGVLSAGWRGGEATNGFARQDKGRATGRTEPGSRSIAPSPDHVTETIFATLLTAIRSPDEHFRGRIELCRSLEQIGPSQIAGLLGLAQKLPLKYRKELSAALLERWFEADAAGAEQWLRGNGHSGEFMAIWARFAPATALREMIAGSVLSLGASTIALDQLAGKDPKARMAVLASLPPSGNRDRAVESELWNWAATDPAAAFRAAQMLITGPDRERAEKYLLIAWAHKDPGAAAMKAREIFPSPKAGLFGDEFMTRFTQSLAQYDPTVAMDFALSLDEELSEYPLVAAAAGWAKTDPAAALAWSYEKGLDITSDLRSARFSSSETVLYEALKSDPGVTAQWLLTLPADAERDRILAKACAQLIGSAASETLLPRSGAPLDELYDNLSPDAQRRLASTIGAQAVKEGAFPDFSVWTSRFGDTPARGAAIAGAVAKIYGNTPAQAESIIAALPKGPDRDGAIAAVVSSQSYNSPADAAQRTFLIGDEASRHEALDDVISQWLRRDDEACRAWLAGAKGLPSDWVTAWLKQSSAKN